eukprot:881519-Pyramimonas_sp.AAC.1
MPPSCRGRAPRAWPEINAELPRCVAAWASALTLQRPGLPSPQWRSPPSPRSAPVRGPRSTMHETPLAP